MQWIYVWFVLVILVTVLNKTLLSVLHCPYATTLTLTHLLSSALYSYLIYLFAPTYFNKKPISNKTFRNISLMSIIFTANITLSTFSLKYCSLALDQMVRCTVPAWTAILQYFITGETVSLPVALSLIPVIIGSIMVCYGDIWVTPLGLTLLLISVLISTLKGIISKMVLSGEQKISPLHTLLINSTLGFLELTPFSLLGETTFYTDYIVHTSWINLLLIIFNGFIAFSVNFTNFNAIKQTSALMMNVAANLRQVLLVILSVFFFKQPITPLGIVGSVITVIGSFWYTYERSTNLKLIKKQDAISLNNKQIIKEEQGEEEDEIEPLLQRDTLNNRQI